ncbi:hypothetical protein [Asticcacaulis sp. 201]|uniref:hypothetical protein n=1 Tax=Asticcacaulis sp. 201 TaxID=3028787 RepID=UPI002916287F|nr:hypothetical protein [Asticcacaulis sp. 201]MDV6332458.1 hypothetical protein [Asticcacaulis sp. 201]
MPKPIMRKVLILWAMLLIAQFLLAAYQIYKNMTFGMPVGQALTQISPITAGLSLLLFLVSYAQYRNKP